jgi:hypothetical protein
MAATAPVKNEANCDRVDHRPALQIQIAKQTQSHSRTPGGATRRASRLLLAPVKNKANFGRLGSVGGSSPPVGWGGLVWKGSYRPAGSSTKPGRPSAVDPPPGDAP